MMMQRLLLTLLLLCLTSPSAGQSVCLPAPRLLTMMPMGGAVDSQVEVTITGQHIEEVDQLLFSHPGIQAEPQVDASGEAIPNKYIVSISADCPPGIHEARVMARLGISSSRVFVIGTLPEVQQDAPSTAVASAMPLAANTICNATAPTQAANYYAFQAKKGQRLVVDCAARAIESKMNPVVVVADADGNDLVAQRRGGAVDFTPREDGTLIIKVHDLTFNGGAEYFYRLVIQEVGQDAQISRLPSIRSVNSFSWPPVGLPDQAATQEAEPNNRPAEAQVINLPCDLAGAFYPAADVDTFEFTAKAGDTWWIEVGSERLGRPTDPSLVVHRITGEGVNEQQTEVIELSDIASPLKRSSNGYSYDGPPYNAGSTDIMGKLEIKEDGRYRMQLTDLFGGTRSNPANNYRLIVRKAAPDFALVAWALHMGLRNGDRAALSKPIALRGGSTMPLEVTVVRRDGFDGDIELAMEDLPEGVTATGLKIPAGKTRGIMLITARDDAPRGFRRARFFGRAAIDGRDVMRPCHLASMSWPVPNAWSEIPSPRLLADVPVSVGGSERAAITFASEQEAWDVAAGSTLKIPLTHVRRGEFSGANIQFQTLGPGFEATPRFDASLTADSSQAVLNLAKLKTPPGEYKIAFCGSAVAKYQFNPNAVTDAEIAHQIAKQRAAEASAAEKEAAEAAVAAAADRVAEAKKQAQPKDIVDIYVSAPITIRVTATDAP